MPTADSSLVNETYWLNVHVSSRTDTIKNICIHHMAGNLSLKGCYSVWTQNEASAHYAIDSNGKIGQYVPEAKKAWACGNGNSQTINIELADDVIGKNDGTGWHTTDAAIEACAKLVADIAKRYGWSSVSFDPNKGKNTTHGIVVHKWYMSTSCPCNYVYGKLSYIAEKANKILKGEEEEEVTQEQFNEMMDNYLAARNKKAESAWAKKAGTVAWAKEAGITSDGSSPQGFATRQEIWQMFKAQEEKK